MSTNHEAFTFALDLQPEGPSAPIAGASTMRLDFAPTDPAAQVSRGPFALTIHTSAAQATVRHSARGRIHHDDLVLLMAVARCAYAEGRAAGGADDSEVVLTAPEAGHGGLPTHLAGRWMGAVAWLHYTDDAGKLQCGAHVERVRGFRGAANIVAAIIEGAVVCPRCAEMHRLEAAAVKTGAQHVDG